MFNRRSSPTIISCANKIRNDGLDQESIYDNFPEGEVSFYNLTVDRQDFIDRYIDKWDITEENKLHCMELTNELVAIQSGFSEIYNFYKNSPWYKVGRRFEYLREHVLSRDENKLGIIQKLIFRILDFRHKSKKDTTMLLDIFRKRDIKDFNIIILRSLIRKIQNISGDTLVEYIEGMFEAYKIGDTQYDKCIEYVIAEEGINSYSDLKLLVLKELYHFPLEEITPEEHARKINEVDNFFGISLTLFELWYSFVSDIYSGEVIYHTYHGTKGREFDNIIIFMSARFGRKNNYFSDLFEVLSSDDNENESGTDLESARNLLYMVVTRATKNLSIVYSDAIEDPISIKEVFGDIRTSLEPS